MRRVTVPSAVLTLICLLLAGCSFSSVDPDADVQISGRALDASGKPLAGVPVLLIKQADVGEVLFGTVLAVGTLSTICLLPDAPALCDKAQRAETDGDGRYSFEVKGSDTQGTLGTESTMNVVFGQRGNRGASTTLSFGATGEEVALPDARLWRSRARASGGTQIGVSWRPLPAAAGADPRYSAQLFEAGGGAALWSEPADGRSASLDARLLEDRDGAVAVAAAAVLSGGSGTGEVRVSHLSARIPVRGAAGVPPSRNRACAPVTGTAPVRVGRFGRCAMTDGDLDAPARLRAARTVTGAAVDLGRSRPITLVVGRGFAGQVLLEVSENGRDYRVVATGSGAAAALEPQGATSARFVRLRSPSGLDLSLAAEISVW